jgi:hypothetical protein
MRFYAREHPEDELPIARVIDFRRRVGDEFDRLVKRDKLDGGGIGFEMCGEL